MVIFRLAIIGDIIIISIGWIYKQQLNRKLRVQLEIEKDIRLQEIFTERQHRQAEEIKTLKLQNRLQSQKERLARELHDGIGSQLTHIITRLDIIGERNKNIHQLQVLGDFTRETSQILRETIWVLNQENITFQNFCQRFKGWLQHLWQEREIPILKILILGFEDTILSPKIASALFRIGQEGVTNSLKYSTSKTITISLINAEDKISFCISDDGKGFKYENVSKGYGLNNMNKRVEELSGSISIKSSKSGTNISIILPIT